MKKPPKTLTENSATVLFHTALAYQVHFDEHMQELRLTRSQWMLLSYLYFCEGYGQSELAAAMEISKVSISKIVVKLESAGWIVRKPSATDARVIQLFLNDHARAIVKNLVTLQILESKHSFRGFAPDEIETLRMYLKRVRSNLLDVPPSPRWRALRSKTIEMINASPLKRA